MANRRGWIALVALAALVFVADATTSWGASTSVLYALIVPLCGRWLDRRGVLMATVACVVLSVLGGLLSPPGSTPMVELVHHSFGLLLLLVGAALTVSRMDVEAGLRREQRTLADFKYALDQSAIVAATDERGLITYANDRFCQISQYARDELLGQDHRIINSGHHPKEFFRGLWETIRAGRVWHGEIRNRAKDGSFYWVDTTIVPFLDEHGRPYQYLAIRSDITERKLAEQRLVEQGALVRLGQMAAVVAHEVKNPLAGIAGAVQILGGRLAKDSPDRQIVREVLARIAALDASVKDLLLFARPRMPQRVPVPVLGLLRETVELLRRDPQAQGVGIVLPATDAVLLADPEQVRSVVLNVLLNAAQAMQGHGEVRVSLDVRGGQCLLGFADAGPGIPAGVRERIFEPFFTTKHRGTGLGLAIARRIIELHGGRVDARFPEGGGTVIEIELPLAAAAPAPAG
jgi:PAS domain S-box-containing protein